MLVLPREIHDLRHLGFCHLIGIEAAHTHTMLMHMEHDYSRFLPPLVEEPLQNVNDELHRRAVVIQEQNLVEGGIRGFRRRLRDDASTLCAVLAITSTPF